jgi:cobaltochelatase CobN
MAADSAPISALAQALGERGFAVESLAVTSLKDPAAMAALEVELARQRPDIVLNTTAFSGRGGEGGGVLDQADAPVFQVMLSGARLEPWRASTRGLRRWRACWGCATAVAAAGFRARCWTSGTAPTRS